MSDDDLSDLTRRGAVRRLFPNEAERAEDEAAQAAADTDAPNQPAERILFTHGGKNYADPTDAQFNSGQYIEFYSFSKKQSVKFKAFLTDYSDTFTPKFNQAEVVGRMDPISIYKNTTREVTISWSVPAASSSESILNLKRCSDLMSMTYPTFRRRSPATPPLFKIKVMNLLRNPHNPDGDARLSGVPGVISNFSFVPNFEAGFYESTNGEIFPMSFDLTCTISVIHDHTLGFDAQSNPRTAGFPYLIRKPADQSTGQSPDLSAESLAAIDQATGAGQSASQRDLAGDAEEMTSAMTPEGGES